jgi:hypothetical protein
MGTPSFGLPTSGNNAPLPIPGNTNPTGTNTGVNFNGTSFPSYPVFGSPSTSPVSPSANAPLFGTGGMTGLSSGLSGIGYNVLNQDLYNRLGKAYGKGAGELLGNIFENGLFNPQVASAFLNAMQPGVNRGNATIGTEFGAEGSRFGSAAALGFGDYNSQVNLNEQQTLASMYQNAQQEQLQLLQGVLPTLHQERANEGGWINDLIGGLEIAGSIAAAPFTGGASLLGLPAGMSELNSGINAGSGVGTGASPGISMPSFGMPMGMPGIGTPPFIPGTPGNGNDPLQFDEIQQWQQSSSAGNALGGSNPTPIFGSTGWAN